MGQFIVEYKEQGEAAAREAHRASHIAYRKGLGASLLLAGPLLGDNGQPVGSLIIVSADDREAAATLGAQDPFVIAGVLSVTSVRPYRIAFMQPAVAPASAPPPA